MTLLARAMTAAATLGVALALPALPTMANESC